MKWKKIRDGLMSFFTVIFILSLSIALIAYGRGWRFDITNKSVKPTGLLAATSDPTGAQVYINGKLTTGTNNTINVAPNWYDVTITKEGYQPWQKRLRVQGEIVTRADAYLFPTNPSLSAHTTSGVANPTLSPDGERLAYIIPLVNTATASASTINRAGIWVLDMVVKPLGLNRDARQITKSTFIDFSRATLTWSPDSKELMATITNPVSKLAISYRLDASRLNESPVRMSDLGAVTADWTEAAQIKEEERLSVLKPEAAASLTPLISVLAFSPDETKILYEATGAGTIPQIITPPLIGANSTEEDRNIKPNTVYVYDIKEDKNFRIGTTIELGFPQPTPTLIKKQAPLRPASRDYAGQATHSPAEALAKAGNQQPLFWLPTNRNLVLVSKEKIEVMDYDATNRKTVYSGPFWDGFAAPWSDASKILILTTLNSSSGTLPNLYAVNLR